MADATAAIAPIVKDLDDIRQFNRLTYDAIFESRPQICLALKRCAIARERNYFRTVDGKKKKKPRQDTKIDKTERTGVD